MLEGSDAKTEIVRGLLLPSPMTVYGPRVGEPAFPQLSAATAAAAATATAASLSVHESGRCGRDSANPEPRAWRGNRARGTFSLPLRRVIMSARSPDWRSGANPSGVGPDAFLDATRARTRSSRSRLRRRSPPGSRPVSSPSDLSPPFRAPRTHARDALRSHGRR